MLNFFKRSFNKVLVASNKFNDYIDNLGNKIDTKINKIPVIKYIWKVTKLICRMLIGDVGTIIFSGVFLGIGVATGGIGLIAISSIILASRVLNITAGAYNRRKLYRLKRRNNSVVKLINAYAKNKTLTKIAPDLSKQFKYEPDDVFFSLKHKKQSSIRKRITKIVSVISEGIYTAGLIANAIIIPASIVQFILRISNAIYNLASFSALTLDTIRNKTNKEEKDLSNLTKLFEKKSGMSIPEKIEDIDKITETIEYKNKYLQFKLTQPLNKNDLKQHNTRDELYKNQDFKKYILSKERGKETGREIKSHLLDELTVMQPRQPREKIKKSNLVKAILNAPEKKLDNIREKEHNVTKITRDI